MTGAEQRIRLDNYADALRSREAEVIEKDIGGATVFNAE